MDFTSMLSDDQIAILGCFGALAACGLVAAISFHFGPAGKKSEIEAGKPIRIKVGRKPTETIEERRAA